MPGYSKGVSTAPPQTAMRGLLIVARDQLTLLQSLKAAFGDSEGLTVLFDRRQADRRRGDSPWRQIGAGWNGAASPASRTI